MLYLSCSHCGYEGEFEQNELAFVATYANGDFYKCPGCGEEVQVDDDDDEDGDEEENPYLLTGEELKRTEQMAIAGMIK